MPSSNLTLTGQWTFYPKTYGVYDLNGGGGGTGAYKLTIRA